MAADIQPTFGHQRYGIGVSRVTLPGHAMPADPMLKFSGSAALSSASAMGLRQIFPTQTTVIL